MKEHLNTPGQSSATVASFVYWKDREEQKQSEHPENTHNRKRTEIESTAHFSKKKACFFSEYPNQEEAAKEKKKK